MAVKGRLNLNNLVTLSLFLVTITTAPLFAFDPVNVPRFSLLVIFGMLIGFQIYLNRKTLRFNQHNLIILLLLIFIIFIIISMLASQMPWPERIYGVEGRNLGSLTYFLLVFVLLGTTLSEIKSIGPKLVSILNFTGIFNAIYGLIQMLGLDPFDWINPYSPVFGFFGNPNFFASFIGIASSGAINKVLDVKTKAIHKLGWTLIIFLYILVITGSKSQQGILVLISVSVVSLGFWFKTHAKYSKYLVGYTFVIGLGFIAGLLDILQKAPWPSFLYKQSVTFRGDYWQAGTHMALENPITGVGLDGFRDNYRSTLTFERAARLGAGEAVDSAHNIFIDLAAGGGIFLLFAYLLILLLALVKVLSQFKTLTEFDATYTVLVGAWVGYLLQSVISINQIGLAIWGWCLTGFLIADYSKIEENAKKPFNKFKIRDKILFLIILFIAIGVVRPLFLNDIEYRAAVKSGDITRIENVSREFPQQVGKYIYIAQLFESNGFSDRSIIIAREAVKVNPRNYEAWQALLSMSKSTEIEKENARVMLKQLNPNLQTAN